MAARWTLKAVLPTTRMTFIYQHSIFFKSIFIWSTIALIFHLRKLEDSQPLLLPWGYLLNHTCGSVNPVYDRKIFLTETNTSDHFENNTEAQDTCCSQRRATRDQFKKKRVMNGFLCSPLQDVSNENECQANDNYAKKFYSDSSIHDRTNDCQNYFEQIQTVAFWPVSMLNNLFL